MSSFNLWTLLRGDNHQQVAVFTVRGKDGALLTDLAPVAASGVQVERGQCHVVHTGLGHLHIDARHIVNSDGTGLPGKITKLPIEMFYEMTKLNLKNSFPFLYHLTLYTGWTLVYLQ